jgi:hypothetical protein
MVMNNALKPHPQECSSRALSAEFGQRAAEIDYLPVARPGTKAHSSGLTPSPLSRCSGIRLTLQFEIGTSSQTSVNIYL